ncbi:MAG: right-handed parallel beta-helix repeat-containing protein, partial [Bacteroidota bacterium]
CIGVDEFVPPPLDATAQLLLSPIGACGLSTPQTVKVVIKNAGSAAIPMDSLKLAYGIVNANNNIVNIIASETYHKVLNVGDTAQYEFIAKANLSVSNYYNDSTFKIKAWTILVNDLNKINDTAVYSVTSYYQPLAPIVDPVPPIPYGSYNDTVKVHPFGKTVKWFHTATGGTSFYSDSIYYTPAMYQSDTFYIQAQTGFLLNATVGTGTVQNTTTSYPTPYGTFYTGAKEQYLIRASELTALGVQPGPIQSCGFDVVTPTLPTSLGGAPSGSHMKNFTVKIGSTPLTALTTTYVSGLTQVYYSAHYIDFTGWNMHQFTTPYIWDGTSSIVIEVCFDNYVTTSDYGYHAVVNQTTTSFNSTVENHADAASQCSNTTGTAYTQRPNIRLVSNFTGCTSNRTKVVLNVMPRPQFDPAIKTVTSASQGCGLGLVPITIKIYNIGYDTIKPTSGLQAKYRVDIGPNHGAYIPIENLNLTIKPTDTVSYTFNTLADLSSHNPAQAYIPYKVTAYVSMSNPSYNPNHQNDSLTSATIVSTYTPNPPSTQDISIPFGYPGNLTANLNSTQDTLRWYDSITNAFMGQGQNIQTPYLFNNTTYMAEARRGCIGLRSPLHITVGAPPQVDASITALSSPIGSVNSGVSTAVKVKLKNSGLTNLTSAKIGWSMNGSSTTVYSWTGNLTPGTDVDVTLTTQSFFPGYYCVKAWSYLPNGVADQIPFNDTINNCFNSCLHGVYTIGDTTGGVQRDFPNFTAAANTLAVGGVCSNVTFLVDTGIYTEQIRIPKLMGVSANSTVTFQPAANANNDSTKVKLQYGPTVANANYTIRLDSANYVTFKNMSIISTGSTYGRVIDIRNGANNNTFANNLIQTYPTANPNVAGIYSDSLIPNNYNTFKNNKILNSYFGIYLFGKSTTIRAKGNVITGNDINGFYNTGVYTSYQDSLILNNNKITAYISSNFSYGIYENYTTNSFQVIKNQLTLSNSGSFIGMLFNNCSTTDPYRAIVANNTISITGGSSSSSSYGLYANASNYINFYANSVNVAMPSASGRSLNVNVGSHLKIINNNFANTGGGFAYYVTASSSIDTADYNNIYSTGTILAYFGANQATLSNLKGNANGNELHSNSIDPAFFSPVDLHLGTTNLSATGRYLPQITDDIDGKPRAILPTVGAVEVPLLPNDAGVKIILFPNPTENEGVTVIPKFIVFNYGTNTITSLPVWYKINSLAPQLYTFTVNISPQGGNTILTFPSGFTVPAGNDTITCYTTLSGDINTFNDKTVKYFYGNPLNDIQLLSMQSINGGCNLTTDTVRITIKNAGLNQINGGLTAYFKVAGSNFTASEVIPNVINSGSTLTYKFSTPLGLYATNYDSAYTIYS